MRAIYSPTTAVLLGDFWLSRAMFMILSVGDDRVTKAFSKCLGDLAEGEMLQLEKAEKASATEEDYRAIIYRKTTSLFEATLTSTALAIDADEAELACCRDFAIHLGQSFQMMDDILDYSPELATGKPVGQDILEKKITLPLFGLFACAPASVSREIRRWMQHPDDALVKDVFALMRQYDALDYARAALEAEVRQAGEALVPLPESEAKDYLLRLARQMAVRTA